MAYDVIEALEEEGFGNIKRKWQKWEKRKDLFDEIVTRSVAFITKFINQIEDLKKPTFAALFLKRSEDVDKVLEKINYNDDHLRVLTTYRPELAESHESFFKVINKINDPENQEEAVNSGVYNLFQAEKHDSVIPLIDALESSTLSRTVKDTAILWAFYEGAGNGIKSIVERFHEHPAITSRSYAYRLSNSWDKNKLTIFQFLLAQADQSDLKEVKQTWEYKKDQEFRKAIDGAFPKPRPAVPRHERFLNRERTKLAMKIFSEIEGLEPLGKENALGGIIGSYIVSTPEVTNNENEQ